MRPLAFASVLLFLTASVVAARAEDAPKPTGDSKYEITIDTSDAPEMADWASKLRPTLTTWYPMIVEYLPSNGYTPPAKFTVAFGKINVPAYCSGTRITCSIDYFKAHPDDVGAVVHEMAHVVQQYHSRRNPGWLVEGVADYVRWMKYEPVSKRPHINPDRAKYTDGYRGTPAMLEFIAANYDHEIVVKMNAAMREGRYSPELWKQYTGKTVEELWDLYVQTLKAPATAGG